MPCHYVPDRATRFGHSESLHLGLGHSGASCPPSSAQVTVGPTPILRTLHRYASDLRRNRENSTTCSGFPKNCPPPFINWMFVKESEPTKWSQLCMISPVSHLVWGRSNNATFASWGKWGKRARSLDVGWSSIKQQRHPSEASVNQTSPVRLGETAMKGWWVGSWWASIHVTPVEQALWALGTWAGHCFCLLPFLGATTLW